MKNIIELVKKFLFGSKVEKVVVKEVKKPAAKPAASKKKK